jgi:hypothetical protein
VANAQVPILSALAIDEQRPLPPNFEQVILGQPVRTLTKVDAAPQDCHMYNM